jgi:hypothetical protein
MADENRRDSRLLMDFIYSAPGCKITGVKGFRLKSYEILMLGDNVALEDCYIEYENVIPDCTLKYCVISIPDERITLWHNSDACINSYGCYWRSSPEAMKDSPRWDYGSEAWIF